jgi:hypothetical protein
MKNLFNDISQEEKSRILEMHSGKKNVISEQSSDCDRLQKMKSGMNPGKGLMAQGYKPEDSMWSEKLSKVVSHANMYKFNGELSDALKISSKCNPSKKSIDYVVFSKGNEKIVYLGVD